MKISEYIVVLASAAIVGFAIGTATAIPVSSAWPAQEATAEDDHAADWRNLKIFSGPHDHRPEYWVPIMLLGTPIGVDVAISGLLRWSWEECYHYLETTGLEAYYQQFAPTGAPLRGLWCVPLDGVAHVIEPDSTRKDLTP